MMNTTKIAYLAAAFALPTLATSCEHDEIFQPMAFSVELASTNTYRTGEPVVFEFGGNADFISVWNGDTGHQYQHRDRTWVALDDIESCELEIEINQQYGDANAAVNNLEILAGSHFAGLAGNDPAADRTTIEAIAANAYADWSPLAFTPNRNRVWERYTYHIAPHAGNFSFGLHLHHDPAKAMRTYWLEPKITVKFKGHNTQVYNYTQMAFTPFSMAAKHAADPYKHNQSGNGWLKLQGAPGANSSAPIVFQGFNAGATEGPIDQWLFSQPLALNTIAPDTGQNIKGVTDDIRRYKYIYNTPGDYTATFIVSKGNYQGESQREVREVRFTIIGNAEI